MYKSKVGLIDAAAFQTNLTRGKVKIDVYCIDAVTFMMNILRVKIICLSLPFWFIIDLTRKRFLRSHKAFGTALFPYEKLRAICLVYMMILFFYSKIQCRVCYVVIGPIDLILISVLLGDLFLLPGHYDDGHDP